MSQPKRSQSKRDRIKQQANAIGRGQSPEPQPQALPEQQTEQAAQNLALSNEAMGNILAATNQAIAALSQASAPLGYQKGVELSQAMNQFPLAMQQGFADHQQATMGRFGKDLSDFQRSIESMLESHSTPVLPSTTDGAGVAGVAPKAISAGATDSAQ